MTFSLLTLPGQDLRAQEQALACCRHSCPEGQICNAPYARVLRARIASICGIFGANTRRRLMALIDAARHALAAVWRGRAAKSLFCLGTVWLPLCLHVIN